MALVVAGVLVQPSLHPSSTAAPVTVSVAPGAGQPVAVTGPGVTVVTDGKNVRPGQDLGPNVRLVQLMQSASQAHAAHDEDVAIRDATAARDMLASAEGSATVSTHLIQAQIELLLQRATTAKGDRQSALQHAAALQIACHDAKVDPNARTVEKKAADDLLAASAHVR